MTQICVKVQGFFAIVMCIMRVVDFFGLDMKFKESCSVKLLRRDRKVRLYVA